MSDPLSLAFTAIGEAAKLAKDLIAKVGKGESDTRIRELHEGLMRTIGLVTQAQVDRMAVQKDLDALEAKLKAYEAWGAEKVRYVLVHPWPGAVCYALKNGVEPREPPHWICPNCYERGQKSHLTLSDTINRENSREVKCSACAFKFIARFNQTMKPEYAP